MLRRLVLALLALSLVADVAIGTTPAGSPATGVETLSSLPPDRRAERIRAELAFAEGLLSLHPEQRAEWGPLLEKARALAGSGEASKPVDAQAARDRQHTRAGSPRQEVPWCR